MQDVIEVGPEQLQGFLMMFLGRYQTRDERVAAVEQALRGPAGKGWRRELGKWATWLVPVEDLVPDAYRPWRPLVRDAMEFVVSRLAPARLAPKVVEQIEAPPDMPAEQRLLRLIAKVPGLQKIGQVLARNRNFQPRFRRALSQLENGISDVTVEDVRAIVLEQLGPNIETYRVKVASTMLSEASVSAVVGFTWRNPETGRRERGVFKVLKPHIPGCFAEDMKIIQQLARFLSRKYMSESSRFAGLADTLTEIRLLLGHEVDFRREQSVLPAAGRVYGSIPGVRVPRLIEPLSTPTITALTHENGVKVTDAFRRRSTARTRVAERLVESLIGVPALARQKHVIFHADPHAGNLLYDKRRGELVILDWALTERLNRVQRRHMALLVMMTALRDADGMTRAIEHLTLLGAADPAVQERLIRGSVTRFLDAMPLRYLPGPMDAMKVLDEVAREGVRFPAPLVMFRKATFTLDGVVEDVAGAEVDVDSVLARYGLTHWVAAGTALFSLLLPHNWIALQWSALTFGSRFCTEVVSRPFRLLTEPAHAIAAEPISG